MIEHPAHILVNKQEVTIVALDLWHDAVGVTALILMSSKQINTVDTCNGHGSAN